MYVHVDMRKTIAISSSDFRITFDLRRKLKIILFIIKNNKDIFMNIHNIYVHFTSISIHNKYISLYSNKCFVLLNAVNIIVSPY